MHFLLHGQNAVALDERVAELRSRHDATGFGTSTLDLSTAGLDTVRAAVQAAPFFGGQRVVVLDKLTGAAGADSADDDDDETPRAGRTKGVSAAELKPVLETAPPSTMLILRQQGTLPARSVIMKLAGGADWTVEAYPVPRGRELVDWVSERALRAGAEIDRAAAEELLQRLFPSVWRQEGRYETRSIDMRLLATELDKLACAAEGAIGVALVSELITDRSGYTPFKLADDVYEGRTEAALRELDNVLATGEPPERVLAQLARETTAQVAARQVDEFDTKQVADASEISAGQLGVIVQRKSAWRKAQALGVAAEETRRAEWLVKTGRSPRAEAVIVPLVAALAETFRDTPGPHRGRRG